MFILKNILNFMKNSTANHVKISRGNKPTPIMRETQ